ncbi:ABC transporter permease [Coraliomargarita parva]|uniref:ABC transporter permease n=1 Tax=Coraliomargarita parva TaxID=3014050 RepID=UPI0022B2F3E8|nr:FtsX-like permease family protein [Coraliomargarita parva]
MMFWLRFSWLNLLRNRRRAFFTISAIALAYLSINLLSGFMLYVFRGLEDTYVYAFEGGHLTVSPAHMEAGQDATFFGAEELAAILDLLDSQEEVLLATPRIQLTGLLSNGTESTIMMAEARDAQDGRRIRSEGRGLIRELQLYEGADLADAGPYEIGVSYGMAERLSVGLGGDVIAMSNTVDGYMNALDAKVVQLQDAPLEVLDAVLVTMPMGFARELLDADGAGKVVVLLRRGASLGAMEDRVAQLLASAGYSVRVENWKDLRVSYHRIRNMFQVIFSFVFVIVLLIVVLSVVNTVGMAVMERIRETGTLRAMGLKPAGVVRLFALESMWMASMGCVSGLVAYGLVWSAVQWWRPTWIPPNIPKRVPWEISLAPGVLAGSAMVLVLLAILAAWFPARKAARMAIPDALTHN